MVTYFLVSTQFWLNFFSTSTHQLEKRNRMIRAALNFMRVSKLTMLVYSANLHYVLVRIYVLMNHNVPATCVFTLQIGRILAMFAIGSLPEFRCSYRYFTCTEILVTFPIQICLNRSDFSMRILCIRSIPTRMCLSRQGRELAQEQSMQRWNPRYI